MTTQQKTPTAGTVGALQETTRADETRQDKGSTLASTAVGVINWTADAATPAPVAEKKLTKRERERAAYLATAKVRRIGPGHYEAESGSRSGEWYTCLLVRGHLSCSCPATGPCKHLLLVTPLLLADARLLEREHREAAAPSLLGPERLAAARLSAGYDEGEPLWGAG